MLHKRENFACANKQLDFSGTKSECVYGICTLLFVQLLCAYNVPVEKRSTIVRLLDSVEEHLQALEGVMEVSVVVLLQSEVFVRK